MGKGRRTEITVETRRLLVVGRADGSVQAWCAGCGAVARMISPERAAALAGVGTRVFCRMVEAGQVHCAERPGGGSLVCLTSLLSASGD